MLLIANRGEIAVRIARTARVMGVRSVAVYSAVDVDAMHLTACDDAVALTTADGGPADYLDGAAILKAARAAGATLVHPGYGFLSENADFADAVAAAGLAWVGPTGAQMRALGSKLGARAVAVSLGVPVLPSAGVDDAAEVVAAVGFPLLIKAQHAGHNLTTQKEPLTGSQSMRGAYLNTGSQDAGADPNWAGGKYVGKAAGGVAFDPSAAELRASRARLDAAKRAQ